MIGRTRALVAPAAIAASALVACGSSDSGTHSERVPAAEPLRLDETEVGWRRLGRGFVATGIPLTATVGPSGGELKGKVVVRANSARRLGLWPNPDKIKDRSVGKRRVEVEAGERRTILIRPHRRYRTDFRTAGWNRLHNASYQLRAVLRDDEGRKVARLEQAIKVR